MYKADGFDKAIIGYTRIAGRDDVLAYDYWKCIDILIERDGMKAEDAIEYMEFNVVSAYFGEGTPAFIYHTGLEELEDGYEEPEQYPQIRSGNDN